jgi:hypothetical protein
MAFTATQLEVITTWCSSGPDLQAERGHARPRFFGDDDERPTRYLEGAGDVVSRQRRFMGWFMFDYRAAASNSSARVLARRSSRFTRQTSVRLVRWWLR